MIKGLKKGRKSRYSDAEIAEMRRLYAEGWTYSALQERFKCSNETVAYYCVPGHRERKVERQLRVQKENPGHFAEIRNKHRNKYSTYYQRRWRWSKKLKDAERWAADCF